MNAKRSSNQSLDLVVTCSSTYYNIQEINEGRIVSAWGCEICDVPELWITCLRQSGIVNLRMLIARSINIGDHTEKRNS